MGRQGLRSGEEVLQLLCIAGAVTLICTVVAQLITVGYSVDLQSVLYLIVGTTVSALPAVIGWRQLKQANRIDRQPLETVQWATLGRTELQGTVRPDEHIFERPLSEGDCLCASIEIDEYVPGRGADWLPRGKRIVGEPFVLDDETGTARIEPTAEMRVEATGANRTTITVGRLDDLPKKAQATLETKPADDDQQPNGQADPAAVEAPADEDATGVQRIPREDIALKSVPTTFRKLRFTEHVIPVGEDVFLIGETRQSSDDTETATDSESDSQVTITEFETNRVSEFMISDHETGRDIASTYEMKGKKNIAYGVILCALCCLMYLVFITQLV